jgi:threonine synthase
MNDNNNNASTGDESNTGLALDKSKTNNQTVNSIVNGLFLLDGAAAQVPPIGLELVDQRKLASDASRTTIERLEAYEDIIDSEVGDTSLTRARNIERQVGLRQIYLKFEGSNPTGTQKDRIAFAQAMDALRRGFDCMTTASCGNYGVALALAASSAGLRCKILIPENYSSRRVDEMFRHGTEIRRIKGDYEHTVEVSRELAAKEEIYDANPGSDNTMLQLQAYGQIAGEIYDELRDAPAVVAIPVSNGTTLAGIYRGFLSLYRRGKTSRMPKIVAGSSFRKNPIVQSYLKNTERCEDLDPSKIKETLVNEPLINWHSIDGDEALLAIRTTGGWAAYASDKDLMSFSRLVREQEGLSVLPASTAGLIVLLDRLRTDQLPPDRYVAVLTGRR